MGFTPAVVDGDIILAAWGNEIRDRTLQVFANTAERDQQWVGPPDGSSCVTLDTHTRWQRVGGTWAEVLKVQTADVAAATDQYGNVTIALPAGARSISGVATGSQVQYPHVINVNTQDAPIGGAGVMFNVRNMDTSPVANTVITLSYIIWYR